MPYKVIVGTKKGNSFISPRTFKTKSSAFAGIKQAKKMKVLGYKHFIIKKI